MTFVDKNERCGYFWLCFMGDTVKLLSLGHGIGYVYLLINVIVGIHKILITFCIIQDESFPLTASSARLTSREAVISNANTHATTTSIYHAQIMAKHTASFFLSVASIQLAQELIDPLQAWGEVGCSGIKDAVGVHLWTNVAFEETRTSAVLIRCEDSGCDLNFVTSNSLYGPIQLARSF